MKQTASCLKLCLTPFSVGRSVGRAVGRSVGRSVGRAVGRSRHASIWLSEQVPSRCSGGLQLLHCSGDGLFYVATAPRSVGSRR